jgi:hypothetical protein
MAIAKQMLWPGRRNMPAQYLKQYPKI